MLVMSLKLRHAYPNKVSLMKNIFFDNEISVWIGYWFELVDIGWIS